MSRGFRDGIAQRRSSASARSLRSRLNEDRDEGNCTFEMVLGAECPTERALVRDRSR
jgi:hypothetical protein